jgi:putative membrane protein
MTEEIKKIDRQREHQANERTFLAWLRTAIALIGFGFAIARFGIFLRQIHMSITQQGYTNDRTFSSETLGICLVIFGILTIALAAWRYDRVFWQIERGDYRPDRFMVWMMTGVVIFLGILSLPLLMWRNENNTQPVPKRSRLLDPVSKYSR